MSVVGSGILLIIGTALGLIILWQQPWFQAWVFQKSMTLQAGTLEEPKASSESPYEGPVLRVADLSSGEQLFDSTQIWQAHLRFTEEQWNDLGPRRIAPVPNWLRPDGTPILRNPLAARPGIAGVLGWDLPWSSGDVDFGGMSFTNAAVRYKGNGTFLAGLRSYRRPFKIDLNEHVKDQQLLGRKSLNLHNLEADHSCVRDTLAYEFFRDAGVPSPRTAFVRLFLSIDNRWENRLLGLYLLVENPDSEWLRSVFRKDDIALFKPVTRELFQDLGSSWSEYQEIYDPKAKVPDAVRERLIGLCQLGTSADDATFARRIGEFIDLEEFARFMACTVLLSSYDSILDNGQNYLLWFDPASNRFGFSPWDMDHSWGEFPFVGGLRERERASLFHPWVGNNRFLERIFAAEDFQVHYRRELTRLLDTLFIPEKLNQRIDELSAVIRPALAEMGHDRVTRFELAIGKEPEPPEDDAASDKIKPPFSHQLKYFITVRAAEARAQLEGRSTGTIIHRKRN